MKNRIFQKNQPVNYANRRYIVLFSNKTTTKLIGENEKIKRFDFNDPETGEHKDLEINTVYCETGSPFLHDINQNPGQ